MATDDVRGLVRQQQARMESVLRLFERAQDFGGTGVSERYSRARALVLDAKRDADAYLAATPEEPSPAPPAEASAVNLPPKVQRSDTDVERERDALAERLALTEVQRDAARAIVARDIDTLGRCTEVGGFAAIMGVEFDEYQAVKMKLRDESAEVARLTAERDALAERLAEVGRERDQYRRGFNASSELLESARREADNRCDVLLADRDRLTAALADAQAETRLACAGEVANVVGAADNEGEIAPTAIARFDALVGEWRAPSAPGEEEGK